MQREIKFIDCKTESDFMNHKYQLEKKMFPYMNLSFAEWVELNFYVKRCIKCSEK